MEPAHSSLPFNCHKSMHCQNTTLCKFGPTGNGGEKLFASVRKLVSHTQNSVILDKITSPHTFFLVLWLIFCTNQTKMRFTSLVSQVWHLPSPTAYHGRGKYLYSTTPLTTLALHSTILVLVLHGFLEMIFSRSDLKEVNMKTWNSQRSASESHLSVRLGRMVVRDENFPEGSWKCSYKFDFEGSLPTAPHKNPCG